MEIVLNDNGKIRVKKKRNRLYYEIEEFDEVRQKWRYKGRINFIDENLLYVSFHDSTIKIPRVQTVRKGV